MLLKSPSGRRRQWEEPRAVFRKVIIAGPLGRTMNGTRKESREEGPTRERKGGISGAVRRIRWCNRKGTPKTTRSKLLRFI